jgi:hypothetical protein
MLSKLVSLTGLSSRSEDSTGGLSSNLPHANAPSHYCLCLLGASAVIPLTETSLADSENSFSRCKEDISGHLLRFNNLHEVFNN